MKKFLGKASIERIAERLNMSSRHLRQQLTKEATSFREISNQIANKLGFSDHASFTHAYRGWAGHTPGETRRKIKNPI